MIARATAGREGIANRSSRPRRAPGNENPLTRDFWLGTVGPQPLALFRILLGLTILHDFIDLTRDFRAFLTDDGMLPRTVVRDWWAWSLFDLVGAPWAVSALFAVAVASAVAFTVGWYTQIATLVLWIWLLSLHHRNYFVTDGGDDLVCILLFWSIFTDLAACWSVDASMRGKQRARVPALGLRLLRAHIAVLYFATARLKIHKGWLQGVAIFQTLQLIGFVRPFGAWLGMHPALCCASTYAVLAMEAAFPFAAFSPLYARYSRAAALVLGVAIQAGIALAMRAGIFQEAMLASCALFILPEWFDWLPPRLRVWLAVPDTESDAASSKPTSIAWQALSVVLCLQFVAAVWGFFAARRFPLPAVVRSELAFLSLEQPADLFGTIYAIPHWDAPGVLTDGTPVEVLSVVAPGARPREAAIQFSRWNKFTFKEREHALPWPTLGPYMCRAFSEAHAGPKLASFVVIDYSTAPTTPDEPIAPPHPRTLWSQRCE